MPWLLVAGLGFLTGAGTTFVLSETSKKLALAALAGGGLYWYIKKGK